MRLAESRNYLSVFMKSFKSVSQSKLSTNNAVMKLRPIRSDSKSNMWCLRLLFNRLRKNLNVWMSRKLMLMKKCKFWRNLLCNCIPRPKASVMISLITPLSKKLLRNLALTLLNKLRLLMNRSRKRKSKLKTLQTKSLVSALTTSILNLKMSYYRKSSMIWLTSLRTKSMKLRNLRVISNNDT